MTWVRRASKPSPAMSVLIIAAIADKGVIGKDGKIPWHLPAHRRRLDELTMGHHVIMGRKTFESYGAPLPGRTNIVLTRRRNYAAEGVTIAHSLDDAFKIAGGDRVVSVIGGGEVFEAAVTSATTLCLTFVEAAVEGDTFFPEFGPRFKLIRIGPRTTAEGNQYPFFFSEYA